MELPIHKFQDIKTGIHIFQGILIFIAWAMTIAVLRTGNIDSRLSWEFVLCFLSIPGLIFLTMTPRFPRTQKLAHPYALLAVDVIYTILWISGFASVASWNSAGKCTGCKLSRVVVGFGVFIFFLFALTTFMSFYGVKYYRSNGVLPGASRTPSSSYNAHNNMMIDPDKEAFSTAPHDDEENMYAPVHTNTEYGMGDEDGSYDTTYTGAGGGYLAPNHLAAGGGGGGFSHQASVEGVDHGLEAYAPAQRVHGEEVDSRVHFPEANYAEGRTPLAI